MKVAALFAWLLPALANMVFLWYVVGWHPGIMDTGTDLGDVVIQALVFYIFVMSGTQILIGGIVMVRKEDI